MFPWTNRLNIQGIWNYLLGYGPSYSLSSQRLSDAAGALKSPSNSAATLNSILSEQQHFLVTQTGGNRRGLKRAAYHVQIRRTGEKNGTTALFLNCVWPACQYWLKNPAAKNHAWIQGWRGSYPLTLLSTVRSAPLSRAIVIRFWAPWGTSKENGCYHLPNPPSNKLKKMSLPALRVGWQFDVKISAL